MSVFDRLISLSLPAVPKPIVGYFSRKYIAGVSVDDAFETVRSLEREGAMATLDILGEFITTLDEAETNTRAYLDLVARIRGGGFQNANVSVKLTALGLQIDRERCFVNTRRIVGAACDATNFVRIDMEDSGCTDATLDIYDRLRVEFPRSVGTVLQSRLRRTSADVAKLLERPTNIRLCKGIYLEPRTIAYTDRTLIQRNFTALLDQLLTGGAYVGIATHDELLVWEAVEILRRLRLPRERYEFQMLLGVDPELRRIILAEGHRLRVYVPFGEHWHAYSVRRLRENPQIAGYAFKALLHRGS